LNSKKEIELLVKEVRKEYFRSWRAANKDKVKQHNQNYWKKKALERLEGEKNAAHENNS
jgi:hypothetical protein